MSSEEPFGPWVEPMERAGARDPRSTDGRLSWGGLARLAGVSTSAITNMVYGRTKRPHPRTVQKVAEALGVSPETVSEWIGLARPVGRPYEPDGSSSLLYEHERAALDELIRAITRGREEKAGGERADSSAPKTSAGDEPAGKVHDLNQPDQGDPAPPADIAARDVGAPSRGQQLRERQDTEAERE